MLLQSVSDPLVRAFNIRSRAAYLKQRANLGFLQSGSILLGNRDLLETVLEPDLLMTEWVDRDRLLKGVPWLAGHQFEAALLTPSDGVMDIARLLRFYFSEAGNRGVRVICRAPATRVEGYRPYRVSTPRGEIEAEVLVNAAGAWADDCAQLCGASAIGLQPLKRHLFQLSVSEGVDPEMPFIWNLNEDFYFRPESHGLLFSLCDESPAESLEETVDEGMEARLKSLVSSQLPSLDNYRIESVRACFRTHSPDGAPVIGWDPERKNFFWVGGLGGFGMGASWEIGRMAAEAALRRTPVYPGCNPNRFARRGSRRTSQAGSRPEEG